MQLFDRSKDQATLQSTGTGNLVLSGSASPTYQVIPEARVFYTIQSNNLTQWESGIGRNDGGIFERLIVLSNHLNTRDLVDFDPQTLDIIVSAPVYGVFNQFNVNLSLLRALQPQEVPQLDYFGPGG